MQPFTNITSHMIPMPRPNVDTDQIIPTVYLKVTGKDGLADGLFFGWRYKADGMPDPEFPLNRPEFQDAQILLAGDNFGCGSSREHAPWALEGWGIRAVISTSFADIFRNNAMKNGLLPVIVPPDVHQDLLTLAADDPRCRVTIDLKAQRLILPGGRQVTFPIDTFNKSCMLSGSDALGYLLDHKNQIEEYEKAHSKQGNLL
jgi:3-isopropylmalate/(R)-2-methylmalate dehydratase small subunit